MPEYLNILTVMEQQTAVRECIQKGESVSIKDVGDINSIEELNRIINAVNSYTLLKFGNPKRGETAESQEIINKILMLKEIEKLYLKDVSIEGIKGLIDVSEDKLQEIINKINGPSKRGRKLTLDDMAELVSISKSSVVRYIKMLKEQGRIK